MFGTTHNEDTKLKISIARGIIIYVYSSDKLILLYIFTYARKAASGGNLFRFQREKLVNYLT
jgi:hypothetical protein